MKVLAVVFVISAICLSTVLGACDPNFVNLYPNSITEKCIFIDPLESGTWYDMRLFCSTQGIDADLAQINDANDLAAIIERIKDFNLDHSHYWIGGSDADQEGNWKWVSPNNPGAVPSGAPFWKYDCDVDFTLRPALDNVANCLALDLSSNFLFSDFDCLGDGGDYPFSPICEQIKP